MMSFDKPKFITFEGGEGSGKSTQSKMLYEFLLSKRIKAIHTREIGGTIEAEKIRHLLIYSELLPMSELLLVMAARCEHLNKIIIPFLLDGFWVICDRFIDSTACYQSGESGQTIQDIFELHGRLMKVDYKEKTRLLSKLATKEQMLGAHGAQDRSVLNVLSEDQSTNATTQMPLEVEFRKKYTKNSWFEGIMPDLTFFMDIPPEIGLERVATRGDANKFEAKNMAFHRKIYERFKTIAAMHADRVVSVNCADKEVDEIHKVVVDKIFY